MVPTHPYTQTGTIRLHFANWASSLNTQFHMNAQCGTTINQMIVLIGRQYLILRAFRNRCLSSVKHYWTYSQILFQLNLSGLVAVIPHGWMLLQKIKLNGKNSFVRHVLKIAAKAMIIFSFKRQQLWPLK